MLKSKRKPFIKLSNALKLLLVVAVLCMLVALMDVARVGSGQADLWDVTLHVGLLCLSLLGLYAAIEMVGVGKGYIEDDIGSPSIGARKGVWNE